MPSDRPPKTGKPASPASEGSPQAALIWARDERQKVPRPTRETIVAAAIAIADAEGLNAVSIRKVAAALGTRPMSLYSFIDRKDDLIDLMVDEVLGGSLLPEVPPDWRQALTGLARNTWRLTMAHPWLVAASFERPAIGPNAMRHFEQSIKATQGLGLDLSTGLRFLNVVDSYVLGQAQVAAGLARWRRLAGSDDGWRETATAHLQRLIASGQFPYLAEFGVAGFFSVEDDADAAFEAGLSCVLDGIATEIERVKARARPRRRPAKASPPSAKQRRARA